MKEATSTSALMAIAAGAARDLKRAGVEWKDRPVRVWSSGTSVRFEQSSRFQGHPSDAQCIVEVLRVGGAGTVTKVGPFAGDQHYDRAFGDAMNRRVQSSLSAPADGPRSYEEDMADLARKHAGVVRGGSLRSGHAPVAPKMQDASRAKAFDLDKAETYRALQDARAYATDFDRNGRKAEALYKRLDRAGRVMRPWSTDGTPAQIKKAIEYLDEITSILSHKIGPASRREFPEQRK